MKELTKDKKMALLAEVNKLSCHGTVPWHLMSAMRYTCITKIPYS